MVSTVTSQQEGSRFDPHLGPFCVEFVCSPRVCVGSLRVLSGYSGFLPPSKKNMHVRLIDDSKLSLGVSVSVNGCLSRLSLCGPVMDWRSVQGDPASRPKTAGIGSSPPATRPKD